MCSAEPCKKEPSTLQSIDLWVSAQLLRYFYTIFSFINSYSIRKTSYSIIDILYYVIGLVYGPKDHYINILVHLSLNGIMTSKLLIRESELPQPTATSILISRMKISSVIIPYVINGTGGGGGLRHVCLIF